MTNLRLIGPGRAGRSFATALDGAGWHVLPALGRGDDVSGAAAGCEWVLIAVPDRAIAEVAAAIRPVDTTIVAHVSGATGLDALEPHRRRAVVHPIAALPSAEVGAARLAAGTWFGVAGASAADRAAAHHLVGALGGRSVDIDDGQRAAYHAAACVASNHLVALMDQAGRLAARAGLPAEALTDLVRATVDNVAGLGPAAALTGPVARADWETVAGHRQAAAELGPVDLAAYDAVARLAARLAGVDYPSRWAPCG